MSWIDDQVAGAQGDPNLPLSLRRRSATQEQINAATPELDDPVKGNWLGESARGNAQSFVGSLDALKGAGNLALGREDAAGEDFAAYKQREGLARRLGPKIQSFEDAKAAGGSVGDYAAALAHQGVGLAPDLAVAVGTGGVGEAALGGAVRVGTEIAAKQAARRFIAKEGVETIAARLAKRGVEIAGKGAAEAATPEVAATQAAEGTLAAIEPRINTILARRMAGVQKIAEQTGHTIGTGAAFVPPTVAGSESELEGSTPEQARKILAGDSAAAVAGALPFTRFLGKVGLGSNAARAAEAQITKTAEGWLPRVAKETATQAGVGAAGAAAQTALQLAGHKWANDNAVGAMDPEAFDHYLSAVATGSLFGAVLGGAAEGGKVALGGLAARRAANGERTSFIRAAADRFKATAAVLGQKARDKFKGTKPDAVDQHVDDLQSDDAYEQRAREVWDSLHDDSFMKGAEPLVGDLPRAKNTNPISMDTPVQNALMAHIPRENPIWNSPKQATALGKTLENVFLGKADKAELGQVEGLVDAGVLSRKTVDKWQAIGPKYAEEYAKAAQLSKAHGDAFGAEEEGVAAPDAAPAAPVAAEAAYEGTDAPVEANPTERAVGGPEKPLADEDRHASLYRTKDINPADAAEYEALTTKLRNQFLGDESKQGDSRTWHGSNSFVRNGSTMASRQLFEAKDNSPNTVRAAEDAVVTDADKTRNGKAFTQPRLFNLANIALQRMAKVSEEAKKAGGITDTPGNVALLRGLADMKAVGLEVDPKTFTSGEIRTEPNSAKGVESQYITTLYDSAKGEKPPRDGNGVDIAQLRRDFEPKAKLEPTTFLPGDKTLPKEQSEEDRVNARMEDLHQPGMDPETLREEARISIKLEDNAERSGHDSVAEHAKAVAERRGITLKNAYRVLRNKAWGQVKNAVSIAERRGQRQARAEAAKVERKSGEGDFSTERESDRLGEFGPAPGSETAQGDFVPDNSLISSVRTSEPHARVTSQTPSRIQARRDAAVRVGEARRRVLATEEGQQLRKDLTDQAAKEAWGKLELLRSNIARAKGLKAKNAERRKLAAFEETAEGVASLRHDAALKRLRDLTGSDPALAKAGIADAPSPHERGVEVGKVELAREFPDQGRLYEQKLKQLHDESTGLSLKYLERAERGEFDHTSVSHQGVDNPVRKDKVDRDAEEATPGVGQSETARKVLEKKVADAKARQEAPLTEKELAAAAEAKKLSETSRPEPKQAVAVAKHPLNQESDGVVPKKVVEERFLGPGKPGVDTSNANPTKIKFDAKPTLSLSENARAHRAAKQEQADKAAAARAARNKPKPEPQPARKPHEPANTKSTEPARDGKTALDARRTAEEAAAADHSKEVRDALAAYEKTRSIAERRASRKDAATLVAEGKAKSAEEAKGQAERIAQTVAEHESRLVKVRDWVGETLRHGVKSFLETVGKLDVKQQDRIIHAMENGEVPVAKHVLKEALDKLKSRRLDPPGARAGEAARLEAELEEHEARQAAREYLEHDEYDLSDVGDTPPHDHDLGKEAGLVNAIMKALGFETKLSVQRDARDRNGAYSNKGQFIRVGDGLHGAERVEVLSHEVGHAVIAHWLAKKLGVDVRSLAGDDGKPLHHERWMAKLAEADPKLYGELRADYEAWRNGVDRNAGKNEIRASRAPLFRGATIIDRNHDVPFKDLRSDERADLLSMNEWVADHIARALTSSKKGQGIIGKFFADIAHQLRKAYNLLFKTKAGDLQKAAPSVEKWVKDMFNNDAAVVREVTGERVGAETSAKLAEAGVHAVLGNDAHGAIPGYQPPGAWSAMTAYVREVMPKQARQILDSVLSRPEVFKVLKTVFANVPSDIEGRTLGDMMADAEKGLEYRIAAAVALQGQQKLNVGPRGASILYNVFENLGSLAKIAAEGHYAERVLNDVLNGRIQDAKDKGAKYDVRELEQESRGKRQKIVNELVQSKTYTKLNELYTRFIERNFARIASLGVPAANVVSSKIFRHTGSTGDNNGMIYNMREQKFHFGKLVQSIFTGVSPEDASAAVEHLQMQGKAWVGQAPLSPAARKTVGELRGLMAHALKYMREAGVKIKGRKDFWPVMLDVRDNVDAQSRLHDLLSQPKFEQAIRDLPIFKDRTSNPDESKNATTEELINDLVAGAAREPGQVSTDASAPNFVGANERSMQFIFDVGGPTDWKVFSDLQTKDPAALYTRFLDPMVKRAEYVRQFGEGGVKLLGKYETDQEGNTKLVQKGHLQEMLEQGASPEEAQYVLDTVRAALGVYGADGSPSLRSLSPTLADQTNNRSLRKAIKGVAVYENARLLGLATISSLVDPLGIAVRSGGDFGVAWHGFKLGMKSIVSKSTREELNALADRYGNLDDMVALNDLQQEADSDSPFLRKANDFIFKLNGLTGWTRVTRYMALQTAHEFLAKHGGGATEQSRRYLAELGLKPGDVQMVMEVPPGGGPPRPSIKRIPDADWKDATPEDRERDKRVRRAVSQFVDEAILRPNSHQTPLWHSDPYMKLFSQYKSFGYAIYDQIGGRILHERMHGNNRVLAPALAYIPAIIAAEMLRSGIQYGPGGNPNRDKWGPEDYLQQGVDRSGLLGPRLDLKLNIASDIHRNRIPGMSQTGPAINQLSKIPSTDVSTSFEGALPFSTIYKAWDDGPSDSQPNLPEGLQRRSHAAP